MATKTDAKPWIVISPVEPPEDWGFKPNLWHNCFWRVTPNRQRASLLLRDLHRLELDKAKMRPLKNPRPYNPG
jgi:hypothetical protein